MNVAVLTPRRTAVAVGLVVIAGWLIRAWPAFVQDLWWRVPVDYDDGVYFSASALFTQGLMPYRDFTFVHPPGIVLFLAPLTAFARAFDPGDVFSAVRWAYTLLGAVNIALSARVAHRAAGPVAALIAAAMYATYPEIAFYERNPYLEPLLNFFTLLVANAWLSERAGERRWALATGAFLALAFSVKVWAAAWVLAVALSAPSRRALFHVAVGAGATLLLLIGPFALAAPGDFFEQTVRFHAWRPPDGEADRLARLHQMVWRHWIISAMAALGLLSMLWRGAPDSTRRAARLFGTAALLLWAALLVSRTYWPEYNAALAVAETQLAALFAAQLFARAAALHRWAAVAAAVVLAASPVPSFLRSRQGLLRHVSDWNMWMLGGTVRALVPRQACFFAFEPTWGLTGGRLPTVRGGKAVIDVYALMLIEAMRSGQRFADITSALHHPAAQSRAKAMLEGCEWIAVGWRGEWQLDEATRAWLAERWTKKHPPPGVQAIDLWERRQ